MQRICVFCGSSPGAQPEYMQAAQRLGLILAQRGIGVVFGGGSVGMMGKLAKTVLEQGGEVIGVIPRDLVERRVGYTDLPDLRVVETMHERKALMAELSDAFIALPGGYGTIEEFFEALTWSQLGIHKKPAGLLNVLGYFDALTAFLDHAEQQQFIEPEHRAIALFELGPRGSARKDGELGPADGRQGCLGFRIE